MSRCDSERTNSIANLTNVIAREDFSPALRGALMEREQEIADSTAKIFEAKPDSVTSRVSNIRGLVEQRMKDLAGLLNGDAPRARAELAKHITAITMTPKGDTILRREVGIYLGVAESMVPEARIELATPAFSGRRSTTELLRQVVHKV
jgi:hypothetical protein